MHLMTKGDFYALQCMSGSGGLAVMRWTCDYLSRRSESHRGHLCNNLRQVVHAYVPLLPSSITWYQSKNRDVLRLGR